MHFKITDINWERIFLNIEIESQIKNAEIYLIKNSDDSELKLETTYGKGKYIFCIDVVCAKGRTFLENGGYHFVARYNNTEEICLLDTDLAYHLDEKTRIFEYGKSHYAYTVKFVTNAEENDQIGLKLDSFFMKQNKKWKKRNYIDEATSVKGKIKKSLFSIIVFLINITYFILRLFAPKKGKNILLMSETKDKIDGNFDALYKHIKKRGIDKEYNVKCSFRKTAGQHQSILSWIKIVFIISRQDVIFVDNYVPIFNFLKLSKKTDLIQIWHAGAGFKAVGYCRFGKKGSPFPVGSCHKNYTYGTTGSKGLIKVFEEVWGIPGKDIIPVGMPRLDNYLDKAKIKEFKDNFYKENPKFKNKKIILFAPTYRGTGQKTAHYDYEQLDFTKLHDFCKKENYLFLFKMHPFIEEHPNIPEKYKDCLIDFSKANYLINDLFYVTDLLITDYSSCFYEFSLMRKPMIFYTYDRHLYELVRGVYRSIKLTAPGKVCNNFDELIETLKNKDFDEEKVLPFIKESFDDDINGASDKMIDKFILKK